MYITLWRPTLYWRAYCYSAKDLYAFAHFCVNTISVWMYDYRILAFCNYFAMQSFIDFKSYIWVLECPSTFLCLRVHARGNHIIVADRKISQESSLTNMNWSELFPTHTTLHVSPRMNDYLQPEPRILGLSCSLPAVHSAHPYIALAIYFYGQLRAFSKGIRALVFVACVIMIRGIFQRGLSSLRLRYMKDSTALVTFYCIDTNSYL